MKYIPLIFLFTLINLAVAFTPTVLGTKYKYVYPEYEQSAIHKKVFLHPRDIIL